MSAARPRLFMRFTSPILTAAGFLLAAMTVQAGHPVDEEKKVVVPEEKRNWFPSDPPGLITTGVVMSNHLTSGWLDSITGIWASSSRDAYFFLDSRYRYSDNGEYLQNTGAGFRKRIPGRDIIVGLNAFFDQIHSEHGHDFNGAGFGAEVLTRYIDARVNYYLPEDKQHEVDRFNKRETFTTFGSGGTFGGVGATLVRETTRRRSYKTFEAPLEGVDAELGILIPGLDRFAEVRLFGGYYHFVNPYGSDYEGFKARLEARLLPGVIAGVEYYDDAYLLGGHWAAGVSVSVPFSIYNLVTGRNAFEGIDDQFRPGPRKFEDRMSEMVIRSPRLMTTTSGGLETRNTTDTRTQAHVTTTPGAPAVGIPFE